MIQAIIFDFDGLLADSESLWREAEQKVFAEIGLHLTETDCMQTTGMRIEEVIAYWHQRFPWDRVSQEEVVVRLVNEMIRIFMEKSEPKPGAQTTLEYVSGLRRGDGSRMPLAIASSSPCRLLDAAVTRFGWGDFFQVINSAENEPYGKPHPAVYLVTAGLLGVSPMDCLALEDSLTGLIAAKAAKMKCVAVPEIHNRQDPRFMLADEILLSLEGFTPELWNRLNGT